MLFDDLNEVKILGNATQDPDLRFTPSGSAVMNFAVATNRSYKQGEEWKEEVTYHNIVVWGNLAQQLSTRLRKGTRVLISGRIQTRSWESDGRKNYKTEIVADNVILIDRYNQGDGASSDNTSNSSSSSASNNKPRNIDPKQDLGMQTADKLGSDIASTTIDPDDLPF